MLVRMDDWKRIRENFSEFEKCCLNDAYVGESICPRGIVIDEQKAGPELVSKLRELLSQ